MVGRDRVGRRGGRPAVLWIAVAGGLLLSGPPSGSAPRPAAPDPLGDSVEIVRVPPESLAVLGLGFRAWEERGTYEFEVWIQPDHPGAAYPSGGYLVLSDSLRYRVQAEAPSGDGREVPRYRFAVFRPWIDAARFELFLETRPQSPIRLVVYLFPLPEYLGRTGNSSPAAIP